MVNQNQKLWRRGFTLIELMIVVAIIGILAAIAIPKFADLVTKSRESSAKGNLGGLRSALTIYYADTGLYPTNLEVGLTTAEVYYKEIPTITLPNVPTTGNPGHSSASGVKNVDPPDDDVASGVFAYLSSVNEGIVRINCTHIDSRGSIWSGY